MNLFSLILACLQAPNSNKKNAGANSGDDTATTDEQRTTTVPVFDPSGVYQGPIDADVVISTADYGDFEDSCEGSVDLTVDATGALVGAGSCTAFETPFEFTLSGTVVPDAVSGELVMLVDTDSDGVGDEEAPTAFNGVFGENGMQATFDSTWGDDLNSLRIFGSWAGEAQDSGSR